MRTTIDIPDDLMERALHASALRNKRDAVIAGLEELVRRSEREALRRMAGTVDLDVDIKKSRASKR